MINRSRIISVGDSSRVGEIRRETSALSRELGFTKTREGRLSIIVTEIVNNLVKHAREAVVIFRPLQEKHASGIELLALDRGPGMADIGKCLRDGYSTAGSAGTGLGAISRLADVFDVYSEPGRGTVLLVRIGATGPWRSQSVLQVGAICVPAREGDTSGDAWSVWDAPERALVLVADGLGHGEMAAQASNEAVRVFDQLAGKRPAETVSAMHNPLRSTRGASIAVAEICFDTKLVRYAGLGNIAGVVLDQSNGVLTSRSMVSHNGTVGMEPRRVSEFSYPWPIHATLVMHSDGLISRWKLDSHPGLIASDPAIIAAVLLRDYRRGYDDATVLVARQRLPAHPH